MVSFSCHWPAESEECLPGDWVSKVRLRSAETGNATPLSGWHTCGLLVQAVLQGTPARDLQPGFPRYCPPVCLTRPAPESSTANVDLLTPGHFRAVPVDSAPHTYLETEHASLPPPTTRRTDREDFTWVELIRATVMPFNQILPTIHCKPPLRVHTRLSRHSPRGPGQRLGPHTETLFLSSLPKEEIVRFLQRQRRQTKAAPCRQLRRESNSALSPGSAHA